ncbi:hypothetical protein C8Q77DRAFT_1133147 [Trametes polyzona]|nr:hypothetical protein C8Q77DRAFT_1133147 [Trametes polyzona]
MHMQYMACKCTRPETARQAGVCGMADRGRPAGLNKKQRSSDVRMGGRECREWDCRLPNCHPLDPGFERGNGRTQTQLEGPDSRGTAFRSAQCSR